MRLSTQVRHFAKTHRYTRVTFAAMRVFISVDIEGISGLVAWSQCGVPSASYYDFPWARKRMTADTNAAIRGARAAGATDIVLRDSHGNSKNLLIDELEPGVKMVSGHGAGTDGMMIGIDGTFAAAMLVGYHAMAGTEKGIMEHTISGRVHRLRINGMASGEIALSAGTAGSFGVPVVCVTSDRAGCAEAEALLPGVTTAVVKEGIGKYSGLLYHPDETVALIEDAAKRACSNVGAVQPWVPDPPLTASIEFHLTEEADWAARLVGVSRVDGYTVQTTAKSWAEMHRAVWAMIFSAGVGASANT